MKDYLSEVKIIQFNQHGDQRGQMVVVEGDSDIPFLIKRVFYMYDTDPSSVRGQHANRQTEFVLINVSGESKVRVADGLGNEKIISLDEPFKGVYIPKMIWKDMFDFSCNSVLLVLASEHYDATEYIRDFAEYEREMKCLNGIYNK